MTQTERFAVLCEACAAGSEGKTETGQIGMMGEKRLHMICKRMACEDASCHEIGIGSFCADVLCEGRITEIQTGSLYPLQKKLTYYLEQTDYEVTVLCPVIARKRLVRLDVQTGEVLRNRLSNKKNEELQKIEELYWISELFGHPRLSVVLYLIEADEYRYSEKLERGRRAGRYEHELFPRRLLRVCQWRTAEDILPYARIPKGEFTAKEYGAITGLQGRKLWRTLQILCRLSLLERRAGQGREYLYCART